MPGTQIIIFLLSLMIALPAYAGDINSDLLAAAKAGHTATVKALLDKGVDVNGKYELVGGWTALMYAAEGGHTETVRVLLNKGADVNVKTNFDLTALMFAAKYGHTEIVELLKQAGARE